MKDGTQRCEITVKITNCKDCVFAEQGEHTSTDGFDVGNIWYCRKMKPKMIIDSFHEWHDKVIPIPKNCPLL